MPAVRVAIDLSELQPAADPAWRGSLPVQFAEALVQHAWAVEFVVLARPDAHASLAFLDAANARRLRVAEPTSFHVLLGRIRRRLRRTRFADWVGQLPYPGLMLSGWRQGLARLGVHILFRPFTWSGVADRSVPLVAAVHDLQHVSNPHLLTSAQRAARGQAFEMTCRRAARLVCTTQCVRDAALRTAALDARRVLVVPPGRLVASGMPGRAGDRDTLARYGLHEDGFVLVVADFEPRHNHPLVLTAFRMFRAQHPESELRLVCVGGPESASQRFKTLAAQMGLTQVVEFPGPLAGRETRALVESCRALLVPSLYETIAQPALLAMQLGRPVVCSQAPGLVELTCGAALTFDPHRPSELATLFNRVDQNPAELERLGQLGRDRVARLDDADRVAEAYVDVFREARTACPASR